MEFLNLAITSHLGWTSRLVNAIKGDVKLDRATSARDDQCDFGRWIYGDGLEQHGAAPLFADVRTKHARFHQCVGAVLDLIEAGRKQEAVDTIQDGAFHESSEALVAAVKALKSSVGA